MKAQHGGSERQLFYSDANLLKAERVRGVYILPENSLPVEGKIGPGCGEAHGTRELKMYQLDNTASEVVPP
jgi:hypothetical protein